MAMIVSVLIVSLPIFPHLPRVERLTQLLEGLARLAFFYILPIGKTL